MAEVSIVQVPNFQQMIARHTEKQENMAQTKEENESPETNTEDSYIYTSPNTEFNVTFLKAAQWTKTTQTDNKIKIGKLYKNKMRISKRI